MIFCIEDDDSIRDLMLYALNTAGFQAKGLHDGKDLSEALKSETPRLIILDIMLPGEDGISILKRLKRHAGTENIPIIIASAKGTEYDKVLGLDLGADDYLAKPFGMMEMISRVKAVLRRTFPNDAEKILQAGALELNITQHAARLDGKPIELTLKEYELLRLFMEHTGRVFTREVLLSKIWDSDYAGGTRTVDVHVGTLRTKLGAYGELIKTVRGVGYKMEASA